MPEVLVSRRSARCTQADIRRALQAANSTGFAMAVEILPDGTIRLTPTTMPALEPALGEGRRIVL